MLRQLPKHFRRLPQITDGNFFFVEDTLINAVHFIQVKLPEGLQL